MTKYDPRVARLRRLARADGLRLVKSRGWEAYTLIIESANAIMYHFREVSLDQIESYFA